jgi:hypothetical protein
MEHLALKKCGEAGYVNKQGDPCGNWPVKGTVTCKFHAGTSLTKTRAKGRLRLSAAAFSLDDLPSSLDATAEAIRLVLVTKRLHEELLAALQADVMSKDMAALVGVAYGEVGKTGEYITGLSMLEQQERDRLWRFLKDYRQAGYEESRLELAERQIDLLDGAMRAILSRLGVDIEAPETRMVILEEIERLPALGP